MNPLLTEQIINHILSSLMIINTDSLNQKKFRSLKSSEFLLSEKLSFDDDNEKTIKNDIWGVQLSVKNTSIKMLLGNCSIDSNIDEYALVVSLQDAPSYGLYSAYSKDPEIKINNDQLIAISVDKKNWISSTIGIQASFLSGMESIKDMNFSLEKCQNYKEQYDLLLSFINYHNHIYGDA